MNGSATYVYAVARAIDRAAVAGVTGIDGAPVRLVPGATLVAVVSDVDRGEFEERALEEHREDLAWLTTTARTHHQVVDAVGRENVIAPLALATVYFGDDRVREVLDRSRGAFQHVLDHVAGRSEWGVKAYARRRSRASGEDGRPRSGAEYLRRRRRELRERDDGVEEAVLAAEEVHEALGGLAADVRRHRLQDSALTGDPDQMVLNGAYLVPDRASAEFTTLVGAFADHSSIRVELTGPWVPYSFSQVRTS
ncbi:GvpL/GvpF family gas vesicle protein [Actinomycetospora endophytica]|uniref:GvpL/GvpF family gas vesicle protein n=1 Tax=Actinomycetospora endophytica TaxID=2291215 RepID=A0ABS8PIR7_9PSEU|nr:GvpL/GvpF family gas vesicle protein [Actinomycetospora endophytica]MCD2198117.1 GvpL/GvpF family gas vesicle protein [Actinomycetospora endophytica]